MSARLRKATPRLAALALLALAVLLALGTFVHTDDGCAVERHCLACRFALHTAEGAAAIATGPPTLDSSEDVGPPRTERRGCGQSVVRTTRGPPAA
jgi:hypothetical protein